MQDKGDKKVLFIVVHPMQEHVMVEQSYDVTRPRIVSHKIKWKVYRNLVFLVHLSVTQKNGFFSRMPCIAIILHDSVPANCIAREVNLNT